MLTIRGISKTFNPGTVNEKCALQKLSLHLDRGEFVTIVGSNGAGKSTLFNAVAGNFFVDEGRILLDGQDVTFLPDHKRSRSIGRLFQDPLRGTAPHMTIEENLSLAYLRSSSGTSPFSHISKADKALFRDRLQRIDAADGDDRHAETPFARRAYGRSRPRHRREGAAADDTNRL